MRLLEFQNVCLLNESGTVSPPFTAAFNSGQLYSLCGPMRFQAGRAAGGLLEPESGTILFQGSCLKESLRSIYRRKHAATAFMNARLIPYFNSLQNVQTAFDISGKRVSNPQKHVHSTLLKLGMTESRTAIKTSLLTQNEQQLVSLARAVIKEPDILIVEEPLLHLDEQQAKKVFRLLQHLAYRESMCVILVTGDQEAADICDNVFTIPGGC